MRRLTGVGQEGCERREVALDGMPSSAKASYIQQVPNWVLCPYGTLDIDLVIMAIRLWCGVDVDVVFQSA